MSQEFLQVGDQVRYYQVGSGRYGSGGGWRFGRVIGRHCDNIGINPSGLEMATVRFPEYDEALPVYRLEKIGKAVTV